MSQSSPLPPTGPDSAAEAAQPAGSADVFRVFTTDYCGFCHAALRTLARAGQVIEEVDVTGDAEARRALRERTGARTVPQIWHGGRYIGGFQELVLYLEQQGLHA